MITGSIVAIVTPMKSSDQSVDWDALQQLVEWHIEQGTHAIVAVGTTGESPTVDVAEHIEIIKRTVEFSAGRIPIIAGSGANSTREAIALTLAAEKVGADATLQVVPYYNKPTQHGLYLHFKTIAESTNLPVILYNVPGRTVADLKHDTVLKLAQIPNIVGIKEATGDLERAKLLIAEAPADFAVYSGDDATAVELILMGGKGNVSVTANVAPKLMSELCDAALAGEADKARSINAQLTQVHDAMFIEPNPIPVKWALARMGKIESALRLPLTELETHHVDAVESALKSTAIL